MEYFTQEEARRIVLNSSPFLIMNAENDPNHQALAVLLEEIDCMSPRMASSMGFALGRAVGIREERSRRNAKKKMEFEQADIIESVKHATPEQIHHIWAFMRGMGVLYRPFLDIDENGNVIEVVEDHT